MNIWRKLQGKIPEEEEEEEEEGETTTTKEEEEDDDDGTDGTYHCWMNKVL